MKYSKTNKADILTDKGYRKYQFKIVKKSTFIRLCFSFFCILVLSVTVLTGCSRKEPSTDVIAMRELFAQNKYIIHACGMISDSDGIQYDYTNSKEALENSYNKGNRIIEIDFHYTNDNVLVCGHAWGDLYLDGKQMTPGEAPSFSDFLKCKVQDKFTVMTFDDVAAFMTQHEDMIVVTDTKETDIETYKMIASKYPNLINRFVIQIYHANEYDDINKVGFPYIIYTLYETEDQERTKSELLKASKKPLIGFTFHTELADTPEFMDIIKETDTPLFVHTVNEDANIEKYLKNGISAIYTDRVDLVN
ncbi:glycerophosphodiester phosphodiesterase family protein [Butyrivibrio sp. LC3010]|uniref:glycerophosphodiester phosphodiesterase family protein n=1 Tax=Butyrivibrio sp. LC3010 TaxID=1280680 RepID=UPI0004282499|nr:glycerophosphodiester phosphodiesterase family protein [Butyrivibrio sp. LC3010]